MNDKNVITLEDMPQIAIIKMCEGNPGAIVAMMELLKIYSEPEILAILILDSMEIRGWKIWVGYSDYCKKDIKKFYDCIMSRDEGMVNFINEESKKMCQ